MARLLESHGAWRAANLDGGSSSTLVIPSMGGLVNKPSYKKADERSIANHLGILPAVKKKASASWILDPLGWLARLDIS
jgi:hypothetical protein